MKQSLTFKNIFDISISLGREAITYPGDPEFKRELLKNLENKDDFELSRLILSGHSGTHIDAPSHFIKNGKSIHELPVDNFILPAHVMDIENKQEITSA